MNTSFFNRDELLDNSIMCNAHKLESMDDIFNNEKTFFNMKIEEKFIQPMAFRSEGITAEYFN